MKPDTRIPGHSAPAAGFEAPLEMLAACHARIEAQCDTLRRLAAHVARHGSDAQAQTAAANAMRYFDTAAVQHHADEERDLLPALLEAMAGSDAVCIRGMAERLSAEHRRMEASWARLREPLARIAAGAARKLPAAQVDAFIDAYAAHLAYEEAELLPLAARLLDDTQLDAIGRAMRGRRGITAI